MGVSAEVFEWSGGIFEGRVSRGVGCVASILIVSCFSDWATYGFPIDSGVALDINPDTQHPDTVE